MSYLSQFPEALFIPRNSYDLEVFSERVMLGEKIASNSSAYICFLARDIEDVFIYTKARVKATCDLFKKYEIICYESDSSDNTLKLLQEWASEDPYFTLLTEKNGFSRKSDKSHDRKVEMAY